MVHNWSDLIAEIAKLQLSGEVYRRSGDEEVYLQIRASLKRIKKEFKHVHELIALGDDVNKDDFDKMWRNDHGTR